MTWIKRFDSRHPLLNIYAYFSAFNRDSLGCENQSALLVSEKNKVTFYRLEEENEKLAQVWRKKYLDNCYMQERFSWIADTLRKADDFTEKLKNLEPSGLTSIQAYELYREYFMLFNRIFQGYNLSQPEVPAPCADYLSQLIKQKVADGEEATNAFAALTLPTKYNIMSREELSWLNILKDIKEMGFGKATKTQIENHSLAFSWMSTQENLACLDLEYYLNQARNDTRSAEELNNRISHITNMPAEHDLKINQHLKRLDNPEVEHCSRVLREAGAQRIELRMGWTKLAFFGRGIFNEIGKRLGCSAEEVQYLFPFEVERALLTNYAVDKLDISERMDRYTLIMKSGTMTLHTGEAADLTTKQEIKEELAAPDEVSGFCANPGLVRGIVKVICSHDVNQQEEIKKMPKGSILVSGSTKPHLIFACRKASAIVTDEGGITSHAAIVSRELGIPCIVGTKFATRAFKDNDLIEVDATHGCAKIIHKS